MGVVLVEAMITYSVVVVVVVVVEASMTNSLVVL